MNILDASKAVFGQKSNVAIEELGAVVESHASKRIGTVVLFGGGVVDVLLDGSDEPISVDTNEQFAVNDRVAVVIDGGIASVMPVDGSIADAAKGAADYLEMASTTINDSLKDMPTVRLHMVNDDRSQGCSELVAGNKNGHGWGYVRVFGDNTESGAWGFGGIHLGFKESGSVRPDSQDMTRKGFLYDWVVEEGVEERTRGIWYWRKWASGKCEADGYFGENLAMTNQDGNIRYKNMSAIAFPSGLFSVSPLVTLTAQIASGTAWPEIQALSSSSMTVRMVSGNSRTSDVFLHIHAFCPPGAALTELNDVFDTEMGY